MQAGRLLVTCELAWQSQPENDVHEQKMCLPKASHLRWDALARPRPALSPYSHTPLSLHTSGSHA